MNTSPHVDSVANALWKSMSADLLAGYGGRVSIAKFLGKSSEEEAERSWSSRVARDLAELPPNVSSTLIVDPSSATVGVWPEVTARFGLGRVTVTISGQDVWRAAMRPGFSAAIIAGLGWRRWADRWADALSARGPQRGPIVQASDDDDLSWIAQRPGEPGPWTRARSEADAVLIGDAESLGTPRLLGVYEELNRG